MFHAFKEFQILTIKGSQSVLFFLPVFPNFLQKVHIEKPGNYSYTESTFKNSSQAKLLGFLLAL